MPLVRSVMTPFPYSVGIHEPVSKAREMMERHGICHLPVMDDGRLVSVISDRDVSLALNLPPEIQMLVQDLCPPEAYVVDVTARLDRVLLGMAERHSESALVVKAGRLAGIFTVTDACRCYGEFLRSLFPPDDGGQVA
ncbi:MAG: CBS domain-containing protein [Acidobacteriota bacterium]